jgi:methylmalonyl-CoA/ethylmalonyl-CoA epimerase
MIGRLNHIAIAVPDLERAVRRYRDLLGADVGDPETLPELGMRVVTVDFENSKLELMTPLGQGSPLSGFLEQHPEGGVHHICFEVPDLAAMAEQLAKGGAHVLGDGRPSIGAHGLPVLFIRPADFDGTLIELEEVKPELEPA